jgi:hypothetical protein
MKPQEKKATRSLRDIELEVEAEGREWMRQRLQTKLQEEAERIGEVFPPKRSAAVASAQASSAPAQRCGRRGD